VVNGQAAQPRAERAPSRELTQRFVGAHKHLLRRVLGVFYTRVFRATFTDNAVGRQLAELVASQAAQEGGGLLIRNDYGRNLANAFEERARQLGVAVQARNSYDPSEQASERTFDQVLTEWKPMDLDAILLAGEVPSAAILRDPGAPQGDRHPHHRRRRHELARAHGGGPVRPPRGPRWPRTSTPTSPARGRPLQRGIHRQARRAPRRGGPRSATTASGCWRTR